MLPLFCGSTGGTQATAQGLIAASQGAAAPLEFTPSAAVKVVEPGDPVQGELVPRGGLPRLFARLRAHQPVTIAYLGGSITRAEGYRVLATRWVQAQWPQAVIRGINAGVSGTGTDLAACRVGEQVLKYQPDLVFVEFAVNGGPAEALEGIVRQIRTRAPQADICFIYTIAEWMLKDYSAGRVPGIVTSYEEVAERYQLPSINFGISVASDVTSHTLVFKAAGADAAGVPVFSHDGVHPTDTVGATWYARSIARSFLTLLAASGESSLPPSAAPPSAGALPEPVTADPWEDATLVDPTSLRASSEWKTLDPATVSALSGYKPWFNQLLTTETAGATLSFRFEGSLVGIFDIGAPESGVIEVTVDGVPTTNWIRFNNNCNNRTRGQHCYLTVPAGTHEVVLTLSADIPDKRAILGASQLADITANPDRYNRHVEYLGRILLRGKLSMRNK